MIVSQTSTGKFIKVITWVHGMIHETQHSACQYFAFTAATCVIVCNTITNNIELVLYLYLGTTVELK